MQEIMKYLIFANVQWEYVHIYLTVQLNRH